MQRSSGGEADEKRQKEDTILRSHAIEAVYRAYRRPSDDEVFIRMREELERVPRTSMATIQANVEVDMDELVKRVTEEIRNSFILDPVKRGEWIKDNLGTVICSECKRPRRDNRVNHINFCNSCGTRMLAKDTNVPNKKGADDGSC